MVAVKAAGSTALTVASENASAGVRVTTESVVRAGSVRVKSTRAIRPDGRSGVGSTDRIWSTRGVSPDTLREVTPTGWGLRTTAVAWAAGTRRVLTSGVTTEQADRRHGAGRESGTYSGKERLRRVPAASVSVRVTV